jgi:hypothetical protein
MHYVRDAGRQFILRIPIRWNFQIQELFDGLKRVGIHAAATRVAPEPGIVATLDFASNPNGAAGARVQLRDGRADVIPLLPTSDVDLDIVQSVAAWIISRDTWDRESPGMRRLHKALHGPVLATQRRHVAALFERALNGEPVALEGIPRTFFLGPATAARLADEVRARGALPTLADAVKRLQHPAQPCFIARVMGDPSWGLSTWGSGIPTLLPPGGIVALVTVLDASGTGTTVVISRANLLKLAGEWLTPLDEEHVLTAHLTSDAWRDLVERAQPFAVALPGQQA